MFRARWMAALAVAGVLLAATAARAEPVLPPGLEARFASLLESPLPGGWSIASIRIERDRVRYTLEMEGSRAELVLAHPSEGDEGPLRSVAGPYLVSAELLEGDADLAPAFRAALEQIRAGDPSSPFATAGPRGTQGRADPGTGAASEASSFGEPPDVDRRWLHGALAAFVLSLFVLLGVRRRRLVPWTVAGLGVGLVVGWAWVADDAFISFRYVHQALNGHGLVFDQGERVQGFTHPLWVLLLLGPSALVGPFDAAMLLSIACTAAMLALLLRLTRRLHLAPTWQVALLFALFASESFVAFQTGGLETSLSHLLLVAFLLVAHRVSAREGGESWLLVLGAAVLLTRLDLILVVGPFLVGAARDRPGLLGRGRAGAWIAGALLVGWFAFATVYYGFPLPNTFYAKTGEPLPLARGLRYLADLAQHEPITAGLLVAGIAAGRLAALGSHADERWLRRLGTAALALLVYVVLVGGDYMRGRFLVTPFLLSQLALAVALGRRLRARRSVVAAFALVGAGAFVFAARAPVAGSVINERAFHPESQLAHIQQGHIEPHTRRHLFDGATIGATVMAGAFVDDPRLQWLDGHGLTDAFIARCPPVADARAGHVERRVPRAYFEAHGDLALLEDGRARFDAGDPRLEDEARALRDGAQWPSETLERRYEEIALLTRGPIWDPERLALIPRYTFTRAAIPVGDDVPTHEVPP